MKNKGFTLVELMAVIILLAIVATIAYSSYRSVNKNIRKQQFENKISLIETKAAEYANDTKIMITNVDTLVKKGYLAADTEDDNVLSPIDNSSMNCYVFSMYKSEDNYYGEYLEKEECDASKLDTVNGNIIINKYVSAGGIKIEEEPLEKNDWTNKDVWLEIQSNNPDIILDEDTIYSVKWISQLGEETNNSTTKIVSASYLIDTTYTVEVTMNNGNKYRAETLVRIDKARPNISKVEIENENDWTKEKKINVSAHDEGSGIYGYAIIKEEERCEEAEYKENPNEIYEDIISENGFYYICAKDKAGNVSEKTDSGFIEIKNIDNEEPECGVTIATASNKYGWYNTDVKFIFDDGRNSEDSGILEKNIFINGRNLEDREITFNEKDVKYYWTLNYDVKGLKAVIRVKDKAGNVCEREITVNRDATKPSCTNSGDNTSWTRYPVTIYYGCNDNLSRCLTSGGSKTYRTSTKTDTIYSYTISDYAGNERVCPSRTANVYLDDCSSTSRVRTSTGSCSKVCGGGTRRYYFNNVGTFSGTFVCSTGSDTESCNTQPCVVDASTKGATSSQSCTSSCHSGYCGACSGGCSYEDGWTETHNAWCDNCCCSETCSTVYSCPSGWTRSGTTCYSCPSGYYLSGSKCYWRT